MLHCQHTERQGPTGRLLTRLSVSLVIRENVSLRDYTTFKSGGSARYFVAPKTVAEITQAAQFATEVGLPLFVLGGGSNVLVPDTGFLGVVMQINLTGLNYEGQVDGSVRLIAASGELLDTVIVESLRLGYFGLENLSAIPGTIGATPVQNVGAYGVEVKDLISAVETYHLPTGTTKVFQNDACHFSYRDSFFKTPSGREYVITAVHFKLSTIPNAHIGYRDLALHFNGIQPTPQEVRKAVCEIRSKKFPDWTVVGTAGSFFKNPIISAAEGERLLRLYPELPVYPVSADTVKISLGYVLDKICQLKGYRQGSVSLYKEQALVLVQDGEATTKEILQFVELVTSAVYMKTQIVIEPEVQIIK
jgi:UDP-N-acetylmuramate dehydrogenase